MCLYITMYTSLGQRITICIWRLWSLSLGKIAVALCARAQTSRTTERETDRMKDSECSFFILIKMRWLFHWTIHLHQPAGFKWAGVTALPVQITDIYTAHFPSFKGQTHKEIKRPHTYTQRDHTHNHTSSSIMCMCTFMSACVIWSKFNVFPCWKKIVQDN